RTSEERRRGPQPGSPVPSTSGAAPNSGEHELRNRPPQGAASPQELRGRARSGVESQGPRNQGPESQRGATQRPARPAQSEPTAAQGHGASQGVEVPRSQAPAAPMARPESPSTTGVAPGGGRAAPGGGGRREEQR